MVFPLAMGITAAGASLLNVVEHAGDPLPGQVRGLLVGAIAVALTITAGLWNDIIVGVIVLILSVWAALAPPRAGG